MTDRVTLVTEVFMPLDGLWQVVRRGTVFDCADGAKFQTHSIVAGGGAALVNSNHTTVSKPSREKG